MDPFHLLEEELWDLVLEKLEHPDDILNLFYTYPSLTPLLYKNVLSTCLMPVLFPKYLDFDNARNCRLVSKRWKDAVDNTLVSHSDRKPYEAIEARGFHSRMTLQTPFSYQTLPNFEISRNVVSSQDTHTEIMLFPVDANPFIGRSLSIQVKSRHREPTAALELRQILPILERFGGHIHYAHFRFSQQSCPFRLHISNIIKALLDCLTHLPNLKTLTLSGFMAFGFGDEDLNSLEEIWGQNETPSSVRIPAHLETLDIAQCQHLGRHMMYKLVTSLVSHDHLQKFVVREVIWDDRFAPLCQHLRELSLKINPYYDYVDRIGGLRRLQQVLLRLGDATNLLKVSITDDTLRFPQLIQFLRRHPSIQAVEVSVLDKWRQSNLKDDVIHPSSLSRYLAPSIRQMIFDDNVGFTINHLRMIPNLEYLGVRMPPPLVSGGGCFSTITCSGFLKKLIEDNAPVPIVSNRLSHYFDPPGYFSMCIKRPVWQVLPRLKILTVLDNEGVIVRRYVKECQNKIFKC